jgi:WD40 repeat protein
MTDNEVATDTSVNGDPDVFLSYSRKDQPFALRLASALEAADWRVWVDAQDIPPAAEWRDELAAGIRAAHTFVFVLSPHSVESEFCLWELAQAVALGKRLVPLVSRPIDAAPEELASRQYILMREEDDFEQAFDALIKALQTDLEWVKEHRHWLLEALRWEAQNRDRSLLVRGRDLKSAEAWLARQADRTEPRPTQLQAEFLIASRNWETRRTQIIAAAVAVALGVAIALGVLALLQRNDARNQAALAQSRELSLSSASQLSVDPERSLLIATEAVKVRATAEADNALRRAVHAARLRAEVPVQARRIGGLINAVAFSPDGKFVAGTLKNGTVSMVRATARPGARATVLPVPRRSVPRPSADDGCSLGSGSGHVAIAFSSDSRFVAAVNETGWIQLWRWPRPNRPVTSPFCLGRTTAPSSSDLLAATLGGGERGAPAALTFAGANVVALAERDGQVVRWSWGTGAKPVLLGRRRQPILGAAFSAAAREIVFAETDGITVESSARRTSKQLPVRRVSLVTMSADGSTVAGVAGHRIIVWRPSRAEPPLVLRTGHTIRAIATSRDGRLVATGDDAHLVRVWDLSRGRKPIVLAGSQGAVTAVAFSPDGTRIVSGADDGVLRVWDWDSSRPPSLPGAARRSKRFQLTRDQRLIALDARDAHQVWVSAAGRLGLLEGVLQPAYLSLSRDGRRAVAPVASPVASASVQLWDLDNSTRPRTTARELRVNDVALSPDGRWIAFAGSRFEISRWPGKQAKALGPDELLEYSAAAFAPDGGRVAAAGYDGKSSTIFVWDMPVAGLPRQRGTAGDSIELTALGNVSSVGFSRDGKRLVAAYSDGALRIWELGGAAAPIVLRGHEGAVNAAAFSPDGTEVVSGGTDRTVRLWRLDKGGKSVTIPGPGGHLTAVAFTPEGSEIIAVGTEGSRIWRCAFCGSTSKVLAAAQRLATRTLTPDERALFLHDR